MITAIPNQPLNFIPSDLIIECPDKRIALLATEDDILRFQVAVDAPSGGEYSNELRNWEVVFDWGGFNGSFVSNVSGWLCNVEPAAGGYMEPIVDVFVPTVGVFYQIIVDLPSITGTATLTIAGQSFILSAPGQHSILFIAANTNGPRITLDTGETRVCVERVRIFEVATVDDTCVITVEVVEAETGDVLTSFDSELRPDLFVITATAISVSLPLTGITGIDGSCVFIRISSSCDDGGDPLCSQPIKVGQCKNTMSVRACLDYDSMGFAAPAVFNVRLLASLVRPRFEYDSSEERWSDGTINRYYIDRQRVMDLLIQPVDESLHPFLAALPMFDHVYIGETEYSVDATGYEPAYGDGTGTAAVSLSVRAKRELMRRVTCDEPGEGCNPINDPICQLPGIQFNERIASDGGFFVDVVYYSNFGFVPGVMQVAIDGVDLSPVMLVAFGTFSYGPYAPGQTFDVSVANAEDPGCPYVHPTITANTGCPPGGAGRGAIIWVSSISLAVTTTTGLATLRYASGSQSIGSFFIPTPGAACLWSSDEYGTQIGSVTRINANSGVSFIDVTEFALLERLELYTSGVTDLDVTANPLLDFLKVEASLMTTIDLSANPLIYFLYIVAPLTTIDLSAQTALTTLELLAPPILSLDLSANTSIADLTIQAGINGLDLTGFLALRTLRLTCPSLTTMTIPAAAPLREVVADGAALDVTSVDAICNALTSATTGQHSSIVGGTSAAPTAASLTARNNYIAAGNTLVTN
jgi:hypothetical protein